MGSNKNTPEGGEFTVSQLDEATRKAEEEGHIQPPPMRRVGGRLILVLQRLVDKMLGGRLIQMRDQVIEQDRELSVLAQDIAELSIMIVQLNRQLEELDLRLASLEEPIKPPDES